LSPCPIESRSNPAAAEASPNLAGPTSRIQTPCNHAVLALACRVPWPLTELTYSVSELRGAYFFASPHVILSSNLHYATKSQQIKPKFYRTKRPSHISRLGHSKRNYAYTISSPPIQCARIYPPNTIVRQYKSR
jgi:hypothetical protein